jgi:hypothetical protein
VLSRLSLTRRWPARRFTLTLFTAAIAALLLAVVAGACTAVAIRFGDHPAYVRAVVDFRGGTIGGGNVEATDPNPFDGSAALRVTRTGIGRRVASARGLGVTVRLSARTGVLQITLAAARHRFKYLSYAVISGNRLVIDLWKSSPPVKAAEIRRGSGGCLTLSSVNVRIDGRVVASGGEHGLFEHHLLVVLRGDDGRIIHQQALHSSGGRWSAMMFTNSRRDQAGTLEVVAASPKDGALACLVQVRVRLPFTNPASQPLFYRAHADVDGDGRPDLITLKQATFGHPGGQITVMLASGRVLTVKTSTSAVFLPALVTVGNVNGRLGDELFVDVEHISTGDSINIYTYSQRQLRLAGGLSVSGHAGLFAGITCSAKAGEHFITLHEFVLQPLVGPRYWTRKDTDYVWRGPSLKLYASHPVRRISGTPPPGLVGVRCGHTPTA